MLDGKTCLVTGGASGIGRATAIEMGRQGARVVVSDINDEEGAETVRLAGEAGAEVHYIHCDLRSAEQIRALIDGTGKLLGG